MGLDSASIQFDQRIVPIMSKHFYFRLSDHAPVLIYMFRMTIFAFFVLNVSFVSANQAVSIENRLVIAQISLEQAAKKDLNKKGGRILGAKTKKINGRPVHVIKLLTKDGRMLYIKMDPNSGTIIR